MRFHFPTGTQTFWGAARCQGATPSRGTRDGGVLAAHVDDMGSQGV